MSADREVVMVVEDGFVLLDAAGPLDVFSFAAELGGRYTVRTVSPGGRPARATNGIALVPDLALEEVAGGVDTLLVAGRLGAGKVPARAAGEVRRLAGSVRRTASVCTGAFTLGEAGLLAGRRVTTHWGWCDSLARLYPETEVVPDAIFVRDGPLATSAGVTAGMDLALALVEEDHGADLAREVAKYMVMFLQRPGGQSQFSVWSRLPAPRRGALRRAMDAVTLDPAGDHSAAALAERAMVSVRHLNRLFTAELGVTPADYVERVRVQAAQTLLESGDDGVETVARRCGFGSAETMRRAFVRLLGVPPAAYRARFRTTLPA